MTKSELFKKAWEISRQAFNKFGGSVKSFFSEALKMARKGESLFNIKDCGISNIRVWENYGKSRVYFDYKEGRNVFNFYMNAHTGDFFHNRSIKSNLSNEVKEYFRNKYSKVSLVVKSFGIPSIDDILNTVII